MTVQPDTRVAVQTVIRLIHEHIETPVSARRAAEEIVAAADPERCEFLAALCARARGEAAAGIARELELAGWPDAAWLARRWAAKRAGR